MRKKTILWLLLFLLSIVAFVAIAYVLYPLFVIAPSKIENSITPAHSEHKNWQAITNSTNDRNTFYDSLYSKTLPHDTHGIAHIGHLVVFHPLNISHARMLYRHATTEQLRVRLMQLTDVSRKRAIVVIGPFDKKKEAEQLIARLKSTINVSVETTIHAVVAHTPISQP